MSLPKKIKEWYQSFLFLAEKMGVDINSPDVANAFQSINLTGMMQEDEGTIDIEYRNDPLPLTVPQTEEAEKPNNAIWRFENLKPLSRMSDAQILNLYELAQEGRVSYVFPSDGTGVVRQEFRLVYTGKDGLPHFSGPLARGPVVEDREQQISDEEKTKMEAAFPDAPDPVGLSLISTRFARSQNPMSLTFAIDSMETAQRSTDDKILGALQQDRKLHPDFYADPETAAEREKIIAKNAFLGINAGFDVPTEYESAKEYNQNLMALTESNILSVSTAKLSLKELVDKGLIRKEDGTPYINGEKPWDVCAELAGEVDKTVYIYRPGENGGEPVLDGTAKLVMVNKALEYQQAHPESLAANSVNTEIKTPAYQLTRTERSAQKSETESFNEKAFRGVQAHASVYGGVRVCAPQMNELSSQPCAEFLHFEPREDGSYTMRYKLPEMGRFGENEFKIRENLNYLMRSLCKSLIDGDGNIDLSRFVEYSDNIEKLGSKGLGKPEFAESVGVPKEKQADFGRCMTALYWDGILARLMTSFCGMTDDMRRLQTSMARLYQPGNPVDTDKERLLLESYADFQKKMDNIRKMAAMEPETEKEVLYEMDCGCSAGLNANLLPMVNEYRKSKGRLPIETPQTDADNLQAEKGFFTKNGRTDIIFDADAPNNPANKTYRAFDCHACFTLKAGLNKKDVLLSMETTAPPAGKLVFSDQKGETAMGIYKNVEELAAYHRAKNTVHVKNMKALQDIKRIGIKETNEYTKPHGSHILDTKLRMAVRTTGHTMEELGKRLSTWKVDHPLIPSSPAFRVMKQCFEELSAANNPNQESQAMKKLNAAAQIYLHNKDPKGNAAVEAKLSDYAKNRLSFARDVLDYTSANLHRLGIEPRCYAEGKALGLIEQSRTNSRTNREPEKLIDSQAKSKTDPVVPGVH